MFSKRIGVLFNLNIQENVSFFINLKIYKREKLFKKCFSRHSLGMKQKKLECDIQCAHKFGQSVHSNYNYSSPSTVNKKKNIYSEQKIILYSFV